MEKPKTVGLALICDTDGHVIEILYDQIGITHQIEIGMSLLAFVESASVDKARLFLKVLHEQGLVVDWELMISIHNPMMLLLFTGVVIGNRHLIVGASSHHHVLELFEEVNKMNNEHLNLFRTVAKNLSLYERAAPNNQTTLDVYNELSALNNQLANAQRALAKVNAEIKSQRDRFHVTLSSIGDAVIATDSKGTITFMNPIAQQMTGWTNETHNSILPHQNFVIVNNGKHEIIENLIAMADHTIELLDKKLIRLQSGDCIPIDLSVAPIRSNGDPIVGYVIILRDITARKQFEERELQLNAEKEKVQVLANFIRAASHDIRTPLAIMMTSLDLVKRVQDRQSQQKHFTRLDNHIHRLSRYIETLITMTELDSIVEIEGELTDLNALIKSVFAKSQVNALEKKIMMTLILDESIPLVVIDPYYIEYAVSCFIKNAIFYSPELSTIHIQTSITNDKICIEVKDTGIGIAQEHLPNLFERFYRTDSARSSETGGSGLNLAITKKIAELHHGSVSVDSKVGEGSTFRISVPCLA